MPRLFDLHAHPGLKMYYVPWLTATFHALTGSGKRWNPVAFQTRYGYLKQGPTRVLVNAHYVIEADLFEQGAKRTPKLLFRSLFPGFFRKIAEADPWETLLDQLDHLEKAVRNTNRLPLSKMTFRMIRGAEEIDAVGPDEIGVVHAVESAHALGFPKEGQSRDEFWAQTAERLAHLRDRGVCMIGLSHFFDNPFCPQTDGTEIVPRVLGEEVVAVPDDKLVSMKRATWEWGDPERFSEGFVREILGLGMLVDISHVQQHARKHIYDLCEEHESPVVASHVGLRHFFDHEYNLSDEEARRIRRTGGVIGLILSKRWLVDPVDRYHQGGDGIPALVENMLHLRDITGDVDVIAIGTDFDGLTHPFTDCSEPSQLGRIAHAMRKHFSKEEIDKIFFHNAERVFRAGWKSSRADTRPAPTT